MKLIYFTIPILINSVFVTVAFSQDSVSNINKSVLLGVTEDLPARKPKSQIICFENISIKKENTHVKNLFFTPLFASPKIKQKGGNFYFKGRYLSEYELNFTLNEKNNPKINYHLLKANKANKLRIVSLIGIPIAIIGTACFMNSQFLFNENMSGLSSRKSLGYSLIGLGTVCLCGSIYFGINEKLHQKKAIELFNQNY